MRVTLIQCTDSKHDEPSKAKNLYTESSYFRAMRSWAKARGNGWYILSAKHGLLPPERKIEPYNAVGLSSMVYSQETNGQV
jgi:hypothetical protein